LIYREIYPTDRTEPGGVTATNTWGPAEFLGLETPATTWRCEFRQSLLGPSARLHCAATGLRAHADRLSERQALAPASTASWPAAADGRRFDELLEGEGQTGDLWYLDGFDAGWYALEAGSGTLATMRWSAEDFPYLWLWQECHSLEGYPWYGEHHVVGVEPWTSQPASGLLAAIENGTAQLLAAGARRTTTLSVGVSHRGSAGGDPTGVGLDGHVQFRKEQQ
ncbi:MAG TPA: hypothetical protein VFF79_14655, partial [Conexibacter sp.]|nr:hypothetical protein [Conexibacter sp.]